MKISKLNKTKLKIKAKSLAEEARIIRQEERKYLAFLIERDKLDLIGQMEYDCIRNHRIGDLRLEARATHIARAFLCGIPYRKIEPKTNDEHTRQRALVRAEKIVNKYARWKCKREETFSEWAL